MDLEYHIDRYNNYKLNHKKLFSKVLMYLIEYKSDFSWIIGNEARQVQKELKNWYKDKEVKSYRKGKNIRRKHRKSEYDYDY
jgi:hypothetical protein